MKERYTGQERVKQWMEDATAEGEDGEFALVIRKISFSR